MCQRKTLVPLLLHPACCRRDTDTQGQAPCEQTHILEYVRSDCRPTPGEPRTLAGTTGPNGVCCVRDQLIPDSFKDIVHKGNRVLSNYCIRKETNVYKMSRNISIFHRKKKHLLYHVLLILSCNMMCWFYIIFTYLWFNQAKGEIRDSSILLCLKTTTWRFLLWLKAPSGISSIKLFSRCNS